MDFVDTWNNKVNKRKRKDKYFDLARELKKKQVHKGDGGTNSSWCTWNIVWGLEKKTKNGNQRKNWVYLDHSSFKIGKNTEKSPGDLGRLAVTDILMKDYELMVEWKTHKKIKYR